MRYNGCKRRGLSVAVRQLFLLTDRSANFMTQTTYIDKQLFAGCLNNLILCLENCDGNGWNKLRRELEDIYKVTPPVSHSLNSYLPLASAACVDFATEWFWNAFPERDSFKTQWLIANRASLITAACVAIAQGEFIEFEIGNFAA